MAAGRYDITCEQGATFARTLQWLDENEAPIDLTGYTARMHVRKTVKSATTLIELTTANGRITLTPADGKLDLLLTATLTAAITDGGVYDVELVSPGGVVTRILEGKFTLSREVTR
jgi:hypothetical protein